MQERAVTDVGVAEVRLGSYRIVRRIASGGMGTVYLAQRDSWTKDFSKPVALKVMHPHLAREASFVRMFLDEARVAIQIEHPHVCNVIEVGVANGSHFLVMEYLNGKTLGQIVKEVEASGPSKETSRYFYETYQHYIARIIADAADGLHAAHEAKSAEGVPLEIVHRDVSPHNIMVTYSGAVKVVDFGIAHAKERLEETASGLVKGKLKYASPEQISGRGVDKRTDVWSLGVCLWEAVTLQHPFNHSDQAEVVASITSHRLPAPSEVAPWLAPELETILQRALSADPSARYATAKDMSSALRAYLFSAKTMVEASELGDWLQVLSPASAAGAPVAPPEDSQAAKEPSLVSDVPTNELKHSDIITNNERNPLTPSIASKARQPVAWIAASAAALALIIGVLVVTRSDARSNSDVPPLTPVSETAAPPNDAPPSWDQWPDNDAAEPPIVEAQFDALEVEPTPTPAVVAVQPRVRERAAPKPTPSASAALHVVAIGGTVQVWVDGALKGNSPLKLDVSAGQHTVRLVDLSSGESSDQAITFIGGVERTMRVELGSN